MLAQLYQLAQRAELATWAKETAKHVERFVDSPAPDADETLRLIDDLDRAAADADAMAAELRDPDSATALTRAKYALSRRIAIWRAAAAMESDTQTGTLVAVAADQTALDRIAAASAQIAGSHESSGWRAYLMLDPLAQVAASRTAAHEQRQQLASKLLARMDHPKLTISQREFLARPAMTDLAATLRRWTADPVDPDSLLAHLEAYERSGRVSDARQVARDFDSLAFAADAQRRLARQVDRHYRNANLRIAISERIINRGLPKPEEIRANVNDTIAGANVEGISRTTTRLGIRLAPDDTRLRFVLEARGIVISDTEASSGPVTFYSAGRTGYLARKVIAVDKQGLLTSPAEADADADSSLIDFATDYDDLPLVRGVVRRIALSRHDESQGEARREVEDKVSRLARGQLETESMRQLAQIQASIEQKVLARLEHLGLAATPLSLSTTAQKAVARLRIAGDEHLGAHTPRPIASPSAWASMQLHESAINNAVARLQLDGRELELHDIYTVLSERIGHEITPPDDLPDGVTVTFAEDDPVQVRLGEGRIEVTLSIAEIKQRRGDYRDFQARAIYRPEVTGMQTRLVREGVVQLIGDDLNLRAQIVLRSVFSKMFSQNRPLELIGPLVASDPRLSGLEVSGLVLDDGWAGIELAPPPPRAHRGVRRR